MSVCLSVYVCLYMSVCVLLLFANHVAYWLVCLSVSLSLSLYVPLGDRHSEHIHRCIVAYVFCLVSLSLCLYVPLSVCVYVSVYVCLSICLSLSMCVSACVSLGDRHSEHIHRCIVAYISDSFLCLSVYVCLCLSVCLSLCVHMYTSR